jgi:hypothetical protein
MEASTGLTYRALYPRFSDAEFTCRQRLVEEAMDAAWVSPGGFEVRSWIAHRHLLGRRGRVRDRGRPHLHKELGAILRPHVGVAKRAAWFLTPPGQ